MKTFEEYLTTYHAEEDDCCGNGEMLQACYESWVGNLNGDEIMEYAEKALKQARKENLKKLKEEYETIASDWNGEDERFMSGGCIYHEDDADTAKEIVEAIEKIEEFIKEFEQV